VAQHDLLFRKCFPPGRGLPVERGETEHRTMTNDTFITWQTSPLGCPRNGTISGGDWGLGCRHGVERRRPGERKKRAVIWLFLFFLSLARSKWKVIEFSLCICLVRGVRWTDKGSRSNTGSGRSRERVFGMVVRLASRGSP
jgi:hypothetical protein